MEMGKRKGALRDRIRKLAGEIRIREAGRRFLCVIIQYFRLLYSSMLTGRSGMTEGRTHPLENFSRIKPAYYFTQYFVYPSL